MIVFFSILLALAVAVGVAGLVIERGGARARALGERLRKLSGLAEDRTAVDVLRDARYSALPMVDRMLRSLQVGDRIELLLYQSGLTMRAGVLVTLTATLAMIGYVFGIMTFHRAFPGVIFMLLMGAAPYGYVKYRKFMRMNAFRQAFPDALDLLVSCLRAGLSFTAALQVVSEESPDPLRREFAITVEEQALGLDAREAMTNFARRVDVVELRFFITAVLLQRETGGNLAEVLSNAAALIRDRFRVLGDINTYTVQGKMTAVILIMLPVGVSTYMYLLTPDFFKPMLESEAGIHALWIAGGMQLVGCYVIYRIVNIKV